VKRRGYLALGASILLAGCGWSSDPGDKEDDAGGLAAGGDTNGSDESEGSSERGDGQESDDGEGDDQEGDSGAEGDHGSDDGEEGTSGGDRRIDREPAALLLTVDDLQGDWERVEHRDENCRSFVRETDDKTFTLDACVNIFESVETANEEYDGKVERSEKLMREIVREPAIGDEAAALRDGLEIRVVFRDANVYGTVDYDMEAEDRIGEREFPQVSDVVEVAAVMYDRWRD
jgi:hypothetical protein